MQGNSGNFILIVEDDDEIREGLRMLLELEGYEVCAAQNGQEGLALASQQRPRLVLLDLMMPIMNGWEFLAEWRRDSTLAQIPVIVVSAAPLENRPAQIAAFIRKPVDLGHLLEAVSRCAPQSTPPPGCVT